MGLLSSRCTRPSVSTDAGMTAPTCTVRSRHYPCNPSFVLIDETNVSVTCAVLRFSLRWMAFITAARRWGAELQQTAMKAADLVRFVWLR